MQLRSEAVTPKQAPTARRAATRTRLVDAATKIVARRGFHGATVDEIADEAGFSVGAIYSNFDSKDEVFLEAFDGHIRWFAERLAEAARTDDPTEAFRVWMESLMNEPEQLLIFIDFWAYAVRNPELRDDFAARMAEMRAEMAKALEQRAASAGGDLGLPAETLATVLLATARGLGLEKLADPDAVDDSVAQLVAAMVP
jgi:AcrR family transcriptional regulator